MKPIIKAIKLSELVLWTENPRDPINANSSNQDVANKAIEDKSEKWKLNKLIEAMGKFYDYSEIPTVVYRDKTPIVYDGNRRVLLCMIKKGILEIPLGKLLKIEEIPNVGDEMPCNIVDEKTALESIYRKHSNNGTWDFLERDLFKYKFLKENKSDFLTINDSTSGFIEKNPHLNKRFVKEEIFKSENLQALGIVISDGKLKSKHSPDQTLIILNDISKKVQGKEISTRGDNRGKIMDVLDKSTLNIIRKNNINKPKIIEFNTQDNKQDEEYINKSSVVRQSARIKNKDVEFFGGKLYLKSGNVSNLYRDITDLYAYYCINKRSLSNTFISIIRMSLRLLAETASKDLSLNLDSYIKKYYSIAKSKLDKDTKTLLSNNSINETRIIQLLHTGAHSYASSQSKEQTIAISIIIGKMLTETHGKSIK